MGKVGKILKYSLLAALVFIMFSFTSNVTKAADFEVICETNGCSGLNGPIFNELNTLPGDSVVKDIDIINNRDETLKIDLQTFSSQPSDSEFFNKLLINVTSTAGNTYSGTVKEFMDKTFNLGNISTQDTYNIDFEILFPAESGNEYQEKVITFDMQFTITGENSGDTEVITTSNDTSGSSNGNDDSGSQEGDVLGISTEESLTGQLLGLSDTGGGKISLGLIIFIALFILTVIEAIIRRRLRFKIKYIDLN